MRRPLFLVGLSYLAAVALALAWGSGLAAVLAALVGAGALFCLFFGERGRVAAAVALSACLGFGWPALYYHWQVEPLAAYTGTNREVVGTVLERGQQGSRVRYEVLGRVVGEESGTLLFILTAGSDSYAEPGEAVTFSARLGSAGTVAAASAQGSARCLWGWVEGELLPTDTQEHPLRAGFARYRHSLRRGVEAHLPQRAGNLFSALMLGYGSGIPDDLRDALARSGLSHVVAVSGLHMAVFIQLIRRLLRAAGLGARQNAALAILAVWLVAGVTGLGLPVLRSAIMLTVYLAGGLLGRKSDSQNSLGFAGLVLGVLNPFAMGSLSMQLTFLATLGLLLFSERLEEDLVSLTSRVQRSWAVRWVKGLCSITAMGIAAQVFTLPVVTLRFGYLPLASLFTGPLVLPLLPLVLGLGAVLAVCGAASLSAVAGLAAIPLLPLLRYMEWVARFFARLPLCWYLRDRYLYLWLAAAAGVFLWLTLGAATLRVKKTALLLGVVTLLLGSTLSGALGVGDIRMIALPQSKSTVFVRRGRGVVLGVDEDTAPLVQALTRHGVRSIDLLVLTDTGFTTTSGAAALLKQYPVAYLWAPTDPVADSYLGAVYGGQRLRGDRLRFTALESLRGEMTAGESIRLTVGGANILKTLDIYDIIPSAALEFPDREGGAAPAKANLLITSDGETILLSPTDDCLALGSWMGAREFALSGLNER